ncbi:pentapeptide repeat-containing protein [Microtetraspora malaysiensis]|uniref:pentapeptide repeat-containing protein n=1 Tax=Microtetraspora malaysiensis TaxID=161358 RepID=UPI003D94CDB8
MDGRVTGFTTQRALLAELSLNSVEFFGCDLSGLRWRDSKLSRVTFTGCELLSSAWEDITLESVIFEECKLDYATFTRLRT